MKTQFKFVWINVDVA